MLGSENTGRRSTWRQRRQSLLDFLEAEVSRISEAEGRSRAEVERLLLLAGVRAYSRGEPLRFRQEPAEAYDRRLRERNPVGLRLVEEEEQAG